MVRGVRQMHEVLRFKNVGDGKFKVEILGDFLDDFGVMHLDGMAPFLQNLRIVAATPEEVIRWLREGKEGNVYIENRKPTR